MNKDFIKQFVIAKLKNLSDDYAWDMYDVIIDYVIEDVETCADVNFSDADINLAIGRAILYYTKVLDKLESMCYNVVTIRKGDNKK